MRYQLLLLGYLLLPACMPAHRRIPHAPPEEAARVTFPLSLPKEGMQHLQGNAVAALLLALDDFLPWELPTAERNTAQDCLRRRDSYDTTVAPAAEGVMLVRFVVDPGVCPQDKAMKDPSTGKPIVDITTYAVDIRAWRVLSIQRHWEPQGVDSDLKIPAVSIPPGMRPDAHVTLDQEFR